jgi:hypothetical protein
VQTFLPEYASSSDLAIVHFMRMQRSYRRDSLIDPTR